MAHRHDEVVNGDALIIYPHIGPGGVQIAHQPSGEEVLLGAVVMAHKHAHRLRHRPRLLFVLLLVPLGTRADTRARRKGSTPLSPYLCAGPRLAQRSVVMCTIWSWSPPAL